MGNLRLQLRDPRVRIVRHCVHSGLAALLRPAQKLGLWDRGLVRPGLAADLAVFNPATVLDRATHENPEQAPIGLSHVIVNGTFAVRDGHYTGARAGRVFLAR